MMSKPKSKHNTKDKKKPIKKEKKKDENVTIDEDEQNQQTDQGTKNQAPKRIPASKEPTTKQKTKSNEKCSVRGGKKPSAEKTEKPEKEEKKPPGYVEPAAQIASAMSLCTYITGMRESSVNSYFDRYLAPYSSKVHTSTVEWAKNPGKNRSKEHKMLDHSRVIVKEEKDLYINASHVTFDNLETDFILTQYPLQDTILDFWKMVRWLETDRIISIFEPNTDEAIEEFHKIPDTPAPLVLPSPATPTSTTESPGPQSAVKSLVKSQRQQSIIATSCRCDPTGTKSFFPLFTDSYFNVNDWLINTKKVETDDRNKDWLATYHVEVVGANCSNGILARVFNCSTWPWKKVTNEEKKLLALVRTPWKDLVPTYENQIPVRHKPVVVMCDLGLDRSATIVFTAVLIELVLAGKKIECDALFRKFRDQRAGVFTASMFYTYSLRCALIYIKVKFKGDEKFVELMDAVDAALLKIPFPTNKK